MSNLEDFARDTWYRTMTNGHNNNCGFCDSPTIAFHRAGLVLPLFYCSCEESQQFVRNNQEILDPYQTVDVCFK